MMENPRLDHVLADVAPLAHVNQLLDEQRQTLLAHPSLQRSFLDKLPREALVELAFHQYSDSILWVPMLSLMRSKVTSPRLSRALAENIAHETGLDGTSHIDLARQMLRSLGVRKLDGLPHETFASSASLWLSDAFAAFAEPEIAGWLLTAESLVPELFALVLDALANIGADPRYFQEHVHVDGDEHSRWMHESVAEILADDPTNLDAVLRGMRDAFAEVLEVPNLLLAGDEGGAR